MAENKKKAFFLIFALTAIIYSNSFSASWHFDDIPNVNGNDGIRISELNFDSISKAFYSNPTNKDNLIRPVAYLTFALNWYYGKNNVFGYHLVNVAIHICCAFFLFLSILLLLHSPNIADKYKGSEPFIALLATILWAIHPIQVQAVTYIVQRMASLSALFYILGVFFYLKVRNSLSRSNIYIYFVAIIATYLLALGSKENSIMLPASLFLVEVVFYRDIRDKRTQKFTAGLCAITFFLFIILSLTIFQDEWLSIINRYERRPFTLFQRLLTQPRIVSFYLKQLFVPINNYLSIVHDVPLSTSLFNPITTIPAILFIIGLLAFGFSQVLARPLVAFAILFFLLNHIVESTVIPLELIFEHRNYLPSMFLFVPVAAIIKHIIDHYREKKPIVAWSVVTFGIILIWGVGLGTYARNFTWATEESLWTDAMKKAPNNPRPYQNIAHIYKALGYYDKSLSLYRKSISLPEISNVSKSKSINNIGNIYNQLNQKNIALSYYRRALNVDSGNRLAQINLTSVLINYGEYEEAMKLADDLMEKDPSDIRHINFKGFLLFKTKRLKEAIDSFKNGLDIDPFDRHLLVNMGMALSRFGVYKNANFFLIRAIHIYPKDMLSYFALLENLYSYNDMEKLEQLLKLIFHRFSVKEINDIFANASVMKTSVPFNPRLVGTIIADRIDKLSHAIN